jgi:ABC-type glycerol-3-phosphate transport system substrate-binding protein
MGTDLRKGGNMTRLRHSDGTTRQPRSSLSRRGILRGLGAGASAVLLGGAAAGAATTAFEPPSPHDPKAPRVHMRFATNYAGVHPMAKPVHNLIQHFTADYPNVTVVIEESPGDAQLTKIKLDASADRLPDLFNYWRLDPGFGLDQVARAGKLAELTSWVRTDPTYSGLYDSYAWNTASLDGKIYGIPILMYFVEFLANKTVFQRAGVALPSDWPSLLAAVKGLKAKGELPWAISIGNDSEGGRIYNSVVNDMVGNARALRMHSGKEPIDVPEMVLAMQHLRDLVVGYVPDDAIAISNDNVYAKYVNRNVGGLIIDGSWVTAAIKPEVQNNLAVLTFPVIPGGAQKEPSAERDLTSLWYLSAAAMADSAKKPYLMELARRLSSRDAERYYAETTGLSVPALDLDIDRSKIDKLAWETQTLALKLPANKWIPSVMTPTQRSQFEPALGEYLQGHGDPAGFVKRLAVIFKA